MYQSIHTTLIGPQGEPFEIQIRTWEMHRTSEYGIAAHWKYKEGGKGGDKELDEKLTWLRQLLEWQHDLRDAKDFMESLKIEFFSDTVFVFTPKGDVVELPAGSVPIDFAYRVHTDVGHRCVGARINGRIVPLDYKLANGDIVEIITSKQSGPSRDWLSIAKTSQAKNRIRAWFKKEKREDNILRGKEALEREAKKLGLDPMEFLKTERLVEVGKRFNIFNLEDLYAALGDGAITINQIMIRLREDLKKDKKLEEVKELQGETKSRGLTTKASRGVQVKGMHNLLIRLSRCCNPLPGDPIIGYITKGRGVSVHRADCVNALHHQDDEMERLVEVEWERTSEAIYLVEIEVVAMDRARLTADIMTIIHDAKTNVNSVHARATKNKMALVNLKLEIKNLVHLQSIMDKVRKVRDVLEVRRVTPGHGV